MGQRPPRRRRRDRQLDPRRHGRRRRRHRRRRRSGSSACSRPIRARASCATLDAGYDEAREAAERARPRAADGAVAVTGPLRARAELARRLLVRDLAQLATPAGTAAPLRGRGARRRRGGRGRVRPLRGRADRRRRARCATSSRSTATSTSSTAAGLCAVPGLVDCHTHACFARRPRGGVLAARRRAPATRSCTRRAAGSSRPSARRARPARTALREAVERHRGWMRAHGTTTFEAQVGLRPRPRDRARVPARDPRRRRRADLARRPRGPAGVRRRRRVPRLRARRGAARGGAARRGGRRLPRARRVRRRAGAPLPRGVPRRRASRCASTATSSRRRARSRSRSSSARASVDHLEATGDDGVRALAASDVVGVLLPASALFLGRPMPPARALVDAGAAVALATDFNPGQRVLREPPARVLARVHAARARRPRRRSPRAR